MCIWMVTCLGGFGVLYDRGGCSLLGRLRAFLSFICIVENINFAKQWQIEIGEGIARPIENLNQNNKNKTNKPKRKTTTKNKKREKGHSVRLCITSRKVWLGPYRIIEFF